MSDFVSVNMDKWGEVVSFVDARLIARTDGFIAPQLSKIYNELDELSDNRLEEFFHWSMYKVLHTKMKNLMLEGKNEYFKLKEVSRDEIIREISNCILESNDQLLIREWKTYLKER